MIKQVSIGIEQARFFAYHGYYPQERQYGHFFIVSCRVSLAGDLPADDQLDTTFNYEVLYDVVKDEMSTTQHLIETVVQRIIKRIEAYDQVASGYVEVKKEGAQLGGPLKATVVRMDFEK